MEIFYITMSFFDCSFPCLLFLFRPFFLIITNSMIQILLVHFIRTVTQGDAPPSLEHWSVTFFLICKLSALWSRHHLFSNVYIPWQKVLICILYSIWLLLHLKSLEPFLPSSKLLVDNIGFLLYIKPKDFSSHLYCNV